MLHRGGRRSKLFIRCHDRGTHWGEGGGSWPGQDSGEPAGRAGALTEENSVCR